MRTIRKPIKVREYEQVLYNRESKEEMTVTIKVTEVEAFPLPPENCVILEQTKLSEKEVVYTMTPETYVKYATVE